MVGQRKDSTLSGLVTVLLYINLIQEGHDPNTLCDKTNIECIIQVTWPEAEWDHVKIVIDCESRGHASASGINGNSSVEGLMQIDEFSWRRYLGERDIEWISIHDPYTNVKAGYIIFSESKSGWANWACAPKQWYSQGGKKKNVNQG